MFFFQYVAERIVEEMSDTFAYYTNSFYYVYFFHYNLAHFLEAEQGESSPSDDSRAFDSQTYLHERDTRPPRRKNGEDGKCCWFIEN